MYIVSHKNKKTGYRNRLILSEKLNIPINWLNHRFSRLKFKEVNYEGYHIERFDEMNLVGQDEIEL